MGWMHHDSPCSCLSKLSNPSRTLVMWWVDGWFYFCFSGYIRQTLPVILIGLRADVIKAYLKPSPIWRSVSVIHLRTNMRVHIGGGKTEFSLHLLSVGNGMIPNDRGIISVDSKLGKNVATITNLISNVYPNICLLHKLYSWLCEKVIITPWNVSTTEINNIILDHVGGETKQYRSIDAVVSTEDAVHYPQEFLNSHNQLIS